MSPVGNQVTTWTWTSVLSIFELIELRAWLTLVTICIRDTPVGMPRPHTHPRSRATPYLAYTINPSAKAKNSGNPGWSDSPKKFTSPPLQGVNYYQPVQHLSTQILAGTTWQALITPPFKFNLHPPNFTTQHPDFLGCWEWRTSHCNLECFWDLSQFYINTLITTTPSSQEGLCCKAYEERFFLAKNQDVHGVNKILWGL
jgi:hypothetical protein